MSWLTPFQNLIIRFKIGSGGSSSGGITEELLNSKLAAFYTATETKILNLVNSKLATYVTQTAFNELETKVETLENTVNNLPTTSVTNQLSFIEGSFEVALKNVTITTGYYIFQTIDTFTTPNGTQISFSDIKKYLINKEFVCETWTTTTNGDIDTVDISWVTSQQPGANYIGVGDSFGSNGMCVVAIMTPTTPQVSLGEKGKIIISFRYLLSNTMEEILKRPSNFKAITLNTIKNNGVNAKIIRWIDLGGNNL